MPNDLAKRPSFCQLRPHDGPYWIQFEEWTTSHFQHRLAFRGRSRSYNARCNHIPRSKAEALHYDPCAFSICPQGKQGHISSLCEHVRISVSYSRGGRPSTTLRTHSTHP